MADKNPMAGLKPMTEDFSIAQPETTPDDADEKRKKSISRTKRWKEFLEFANGRVDSYKDFLPGANPAITKTDDNWRVADCIIKELQIWVNFIEGVNLYLLARRSPISATTTR